MKCSKGEGFSQGTLIRYGNIELSPAAGILNYGQVKITHTIYTCVSLVFVSIFIQFLYITHTHTHTQQKLNSAIYHKSNLVIKPQIRKHGFLLGNL